MKTETLYNNERDNESALSSVWTSWNVSIEKHETVINDSLLFEMESTLNDEEKELELSRLLLIYFNY